MVVFDEVNGEEPVVFTVDGFRLQGCLHRPENPRPPFVVGSHGLFSSGDSPKQVALARACTEAGIAYFRFDHRGCGASAGSFKQDTTLAGRCADLEQAVKTLLGRADLAERFGFFGSSFGGTTCLSTAARMSASALVVNAAPLRSRTLSGAEVDAGAPAELALDAEFYRKNLQFDVSNDLDRLRSVLVFHGDRDEVVPVENGKEIYEKVGRPKKLAIFDGGDHTMSQPAHQVRFVQQTVEWFQVHLVRH